MQQITRRDWFGLLARISAFVALARAVPTRPRRCLHVWNWSGYVCERCGATAEDIWLDEMPADHASAARSLFVEANGDYLTGIVVGKVDDSNWLIPPDAYNVKVARGAFIWARHSGPLEPGTAVGVELNREAGTYKIVRSFPVLTKT